MRRYQTSSLQKIISLMFLFSLLIHRADCSEFYDTLFYENFSDPGKFGLFRIPDKNSCVIRYAAERLEITAGDTTELAGVYHLKEVSGNFFAETEFEADDAVGLVIIAAKDGEPDINNYTLITVNNRDGKVFVNQYDRQQGLRNVHDPKKVIDPSRYESKLDGSVFSVPFIGTNRKIRILHESLSNTFHFYYGTKLDKWGITSNDWLEVAPQYAWLDAGQSYFIGLICRNESTNGPETAQYHYLTVVRTPVNDRDDSQTGFRAQKRSFSWSGFEGEATVVTFGDEFGFDKNIKFLIWDRANNAPAWRLSNQFLLNFEFFESGDSIYEGCHEAMSDRQRHGQSVTIIEDNAVRKIIHWHGIPLNPDYHFTGENFGGTAYPYYDEYWTFYPDGTGTRQLIDRPKLDIEHRRQWGPEIIEPMPIGGSLVEAGDICNAPALSVFNMTDSVKTYFPPPTHDEYAKDSWNWPQVVFDCHFKDGLPDFYMAYNQTDDYPETWTGIKIETQISWHNTNYNFSHWPVGREPYGQNTNGWGATSRSYASHLNEVTHTSLVSAGFYQQGVDFKDHFKTDSSGRMYRKHVMLVGVGRPYDYNAVKDNIQTWLDPGIIASMDNNITFVKNDLTARCWIFDNVKGSDLCHIGVQPGGRPVINPAIQILNWKGKEEVSVLVNGEAVPYKSALVGNALLIWIHTSIAEKSDLLIKAL